MYRNGEAKSPPELGSAVSVGMPESGVADSWQPTEKSFKRDDASLIGMWQPLVHWLTFEIGSRLANGIGVCSAALGDLLPQRQKYLRKGNFA